MNERIDKMLALALDQKNEVLILGAWGCGVFKNSPKEIAELFKIIYKESIRENLNGLFLQFLLKMRGF